MYLSTDSTLQNGKYRIIRVLGQGGFGITYLALDVSLDREVAIKEFFPKDYCDRTGDTSHVTLGTQSSAQFVSRLKAKFLKEAKNIAKFDHPGIIRILTAFEENNTAYYVMDFIDGEALSAIVKRDGSLPRDKALRYIGQVAEALEYVHGYSINHLDVKPANIMIRRRDDMPILIDFGLSKQYDSEGNQTSTTPTGISHGFAPIEQYNDGGVREFSPQTDLYSLAATLYYLLSGEVPPHATSLVDNELTFPDSIPECLRTPIAKAMSTARRDRHATIDEFINEVNGLNDDCTTKIMADPEPNPKPAPAPEPTPKSTTGIENGHDWVELGLPSGTRWATCNVGASSPSDYGDYFAWGETCQNSSYEKSNSNTFGKDIGNISGAPEYDAARTNWGGNWRLPTKTECEELCSRCKWKWTTLEGKKGYKVTGPNGNAIFLPAAGCRYGTTRYYDGANGDYWSGTPDGRDNESAYILWFYDSNYTVDWYVRHYGGSIRPVTE